MIDKKDVFSYTMEVNITKEDLLKRVISRSAESHEDYHSEGFRRIFPLHNEMLLENLIFDEPISIYLKDKPLSITILNCEFKKDLYIRRGEKEVDYFIFIYKTNIANSLHANSFDANNKISIYTSLINTFSISGKADKIDVFGSQIETVSLENLKCELCRIERTDITNYSLFNFSSNDVEFDTDKLAISGYSRFIPKEKQSRKQVSEIYHRFVLKGAKSVKATSEINYQLMKATTNWTGVFFGYFYKPVHVILWIIAIVFAYSFVYWITFESTYNDSLYFSVYTFLTIGFGDMNTEVTYLKTALVFSEGLLGILYAAVLLTSIINSSKK